MSALLWKFCQRFSTFSAQPSNCIAEIRLIYTFNLAPQTSLKVLPFYFRFLLEKNELIIYPEIQFCMFLHRAKTTEFTATENTEVKWMKLIYQGFFPLQSLLGHCSKPEKEVFWNQNWSTRFSYTALMHKKNLLTLYSLYKIRSNYEMIQELPCSVWD